MNREGNVAHVRVAALANEIMAERYAAPLEGRGRGLLVVAGGALMFTNAYVLLHVLRKVLKSSLPVEIWHFGNTEISPAMAALVEPFDVRLVDANPLIAANRLDIRDGWQLKSLALVYSNFAEVLLLDADQVPINDPATCFEWPQYVETGAVFWPDIIDLRQDNPIWSLIRVEPKHGPSFESGQLLVDRRRHAAPLRAALRLNEAAEDIYQLIYGDKDTYLLAWEMLAAPYALVPHRPYVDDLMLVQRDFDARALFQHRTNAKWNYGQEQRRPFGFQHEEACLAALAQLEQRWSGQVFVPPDRSLAARELELQLIAAGPFRLEVAGEPAVTIAFGPHAELAEGRTVDRRHWWVEHDGDGPRLVLSGGERRSYVLRGSPDWVWRGRRHRIPIADVNLIPGDGGGAPVGNHLPGLIDEVLLSAGVFDSDTEVPPRLADAIVLLASLIPATAERLFYLSATTTDPRIAARLRALSEPLVAPARLDAKRALSLESAYVRTEISK